MLDKLQELSVSLWSPIGNLFYDLYDSAGIWLPIILFFVTIFFSLYLLRNFLDMVVELPLIKIFQVMVSYLIKILIFLAVIGIFTSLGFYIYSLYVTEEKQEVSKNEPNFGYLLK